MLFLVFGSSGSGKTSVLGALRDRVCGLAAHDFDEVGVPAGADLGWRQHTEERWVRRALDYQARGVDMLLAGQTPLGELLATPSAPRLDAIAACLLDCDDATRRARLAPRGPEWLGRKRSRLDDYLHWAEWMRRHAADPTWRPEVIANGAEGTMVWSRWSAWRAGDPRWRVEVIDTSELPLERLAALLGGWIAAERALTATGRHPLAAAAWTREDDARHGGG